MTVLQAKRYQAKKRRPREVCDGAVSCSNQEADIVAIKSPVKSVKNQKDIFSAMGKRASMENLYVSGEVDNAAMRKAHEFASSLPGNFPTLMKLMHPSHIGFSLHLVAGFCYKHLPDKDKVIDLEDDKGKVYPAQFLASKHCLSGGWRAFSIHHKLVQGDVVVFQLLEPTKFKVYVVRASASEQASRRSKRKVETSAKEAKKTSITNCKIVVHKQDEPKNGSEEDFGFDISDGIIMSSDQPAVDFQQVRNVDDFDIVVNGLIINCELSKQLQYKYYELCSSQKSFLHQHIPNGLNCKLIAGIIAETTNIADAVRTAKFCTRQKEEFANWENTLSGFEKLGMNVEFILTRLRQLIGLSDHVNRCKKLKAERVEVGEEVKALKAKLEKSVGRMERIDEEIERLENEEDVEVRFTKLAEAPWSL
ncbi:unnamed protein product [Linum trigynum]|uniref:TF-B3 domain-containing protein n=1 Tax=Linum trigynum TaxID=586398 RepID=A0AAV2CNQ3_9ROSI